MRIDILTTFVEMFAGPFDESILKRAQESGQARIFVHNLRDWTHDRHHKTDDEQFGGGDGMIMLARPLIEATEDLRRQTDGPTHVLLTTPQGRQFTQSVAEELSTREHVIILCGHYKGVDQRVIDYLQPDEISIGDYVLTGGEIPAMVIVDAIVRLIPGVVNSIGSVQEDSFTSGLLDCPRYTRPRSIFGLSVPDVLLSGNHAEIDRWRLEQAEEQTRKRRPDLYRQYRESGKTVPEAEDPSS
ncbi:MAG: tRNA (guanosine(37)-N1)-methyltransferase TrmD [Candidatus Omnitrophota bacterium]|jgi:tRNA (guanine37-N1)-methyltransferase|nr:MAG: tRNA (guanosine(37)-N1)-methyltransferase TrmD [Candidatus Omnitrophota bacterium]